MDNALDDKIKRRILAIEADAVALVLGLRSINLKPQQDEPWPTRSPPDCRAPIDPKNIKRDVWF